MVQAAIYIVSFMVCLWAGMMVLGIIGAILSTRTGWAILIGLIILIAIALNN